MQKPEKTFWSILAERIYVANHRRVVDKIPKEQLPYYTTETSFLDFCHQIGVYKVVIQINVQLDGDQSLFAKSIRLTPRTCTDLTFGDMILSKERVNVTVDPLVTADLNHQLYQALMYSDIENSELIECLETFIRQQGQEEVFTPVTLIQLQTCKSLSIDILLLSDPKQCFYRDQFLVLKRG